MDRIDDIAHQGYLSLGPEPTAVNRSFDLEPLLNPQAIGIIGASTRGSRGTRVLENLLKTGFSGRIYPINPKYPSILGVRCYPNIEVLPEKLDTVLFAIPAEHVPDLLQSHHDAGTRSAVILSSGFNESGAVGAVRNQRIEDVAAAGMPICGPNCFGILNLSSGACTFSGPLPDPFKTGSVAVLSQSGGFTSLISNALIEQRGVGIKYMISCGNQAGTKIEDYLEFLARDEEIQTVVCYVEAVNSAERLIQVGDLARNLGKSIVVLQAGQSKNAVEATRSHTGSIAGSAAVAEALFRRAGIIQASSLDELVETTSILAAGNSLRIGRRVAIVSAGGGETAHGADAAERAGVELPVLQSGTIRSLTELLPAFSNPRNPLDLTGSVYEKKTLFTDAVRAILADHDIDVIAANLALGPSQAATHPAEAFVEGLAALPERDRSRIVAYRNLASGPVDKKLANILGKAGISISLGSDHTLKAIAKIANRNENWALQTRDSPTTLLDHARFGQIADSTPEKQWQMLHDFGIPMVRLEVASDPASAGDLATEIGFPVAAKCGSPALSHKTDVGGVRLNLNSRLEVEAAYIELVKLQSNLPGVSPSDEILIQRMAGSGIEMYAGIVRDPVLGIALAIGFGGVLLEFLNDTVVGIPPFTESDAHAMISRLDGAPILNGVRGNAPSDVTEFARVIQKLGDFAQSLPTQVTAVDLNPIILHPEGAGVSCVDLWIDFKDESVSKTVSGAET